jgi:hypothetical protein
LTKRGWVISGLAALAAVVLLIVIVNAASDDPDEGLAAETSLPATSTTTLPGTTTTVAETTTSTAPTTSTSASATTSTVATTSATAPPGTLPPTPDPDAGEETDNPVPYQTSLELGGWRIGVSLADLDATDTILDFVPFNDPPTDGSVYVLVELSGVNIGSGITQAVFDWKLQAPGFDHIPDGLECGVIPNSIYDVGDIAPGGTMAANVCFEVPEEFVTDDLLLSLGLFDAAGVERFFALQAE